MDSMAIAENVEGEKHHVNPAEDHTIILFFSRTAKLFSEITWGMNFLLLHTLLLSPSSWRRDWHICTPSIMKPLSLLHTFENIIKQHAQYAIVVSLDRAMKIQ